MPCQELKLLRRQILKETGLIRVWSAGCASGEETYSIAILLSDYLGIDLQNFLLSIYGTDIDNEGIVKAKKGEYLFDQIKNVEKNLLFKYFIFNGDILKLFFTELKSLFLELY
jgi:chemotaxis methyl-accepting protein methylase